MLRLPSSKKSRTISFLALVFAALVGLALGLPSLVLSSGIPVQSQGRNGASPTDQQQDLSFAEHPWIQPFLFAILASIFFVIIFVSIKQIGKKEMRSIFGSVLKIMALAVSLGFLLWVLTPRSDAHIIAEAAGLPDQPAAANMASAYAKLPVYLLAVLLAAALCLLVLWRIARGRLPPISSAHLVGMEARKAKQSLIEGEDPRAVIIRCYRRMCAQLRRGRNIEREAAMTAGEFVDSLVAAGAPGDSVRKLTALFEAARYGSLEPRADEGTKDDLLPGRSHATPPRRRRGAEAEACLAAGSG